MIIDKTLVLSDAQEVKASGASSAVAVGGKVVGKDLNLVLQVNTTFTGLTSLAANIQVCDTESGTYKTVATLPAIAAANLTAGARPWGIVKLPYEAEGFLKVAYTVVGTGTAGKIDAFLTPSNEQE